MTNLLGRVLQRLFGSGTLIRQIATIFSGTATAQVITLISMVPLARLYTPLDFGQFAIIQAVVAVGVTLAALRFDMAVVLPKSDLVARVLNRLASRSILVSSAVLSVALLVAHPTISRIYDNEMFARWLIIAGVVVYFTAQVANVQFWLIRRQKYKVIAGNYLVKAITVGVFQLGMAFVTGGFQGLLIGLLVGQIVTLALVSHRTPELRRALPPDAPTKRAVAKRYRKMPLLNGPNALLDSIEDAGIRMLIANIAVSGLGQYSLAFQMTKAPVSLLNGAIAQVLLQRLSTTKPGGMVKLLRASFSRIFIFAVPVFTLFYFTAPSLFTLAFGEQWVEAGQIAQALVPWLFMVTFTSPLSSLFVIVEKQEWTLALAAVQTTAALMFLYFTSLDLLLAVTWLALIEAAALMLWIVMALFVARHYDTKAARGKVER